MHSPARAPATVPAPALVSAAETGRIRPAEDVPTLDRVARFLADVWQTPESRPPFAPDVLRAFVHAGGAVHYAADGDGVVAASVLVFCSPASHTTYSMIAAVRTSDRGVGFALKQAQRAWSLHHGATTMTWTFDPLVSRNAHFNIAKLGAVATEYTVDFYGQIDDGVNGHDETDRLTAVWSLTEPRTHHITAPSSVDPRPGPDGEPFSARDEDGYWCRVPLDIVATRRRDRPLAARWRAAVREVLLPAFDAGFAATGFSRSGWYRLTRQGRS